MEMEMFFRHSVIRVRMTMKINEGLRKPIYIICAVNSFTMCPSYTTIYRKFAISVVKYGSRESFCGFSILTAVSFNPSCLAFRQSLRK